MVKQVIGKDEEQDTHILMSMHHHRSESCLCQEQKKIHIHTCGDRKL